MASRFRTSAPVFAACAFLAALVAPVARPENQSQLATPAQKLVALVKQYEAARQAYLKATNDGDVLKTPRDELKIARAAFKQEAERCATGCLELAEKHPDDPAALDALVCALRTLDGKNEQLSDGRAGAMHYHPAPSRDGKWLIYGSKRDGVRQLYVMRLSDKKEWRITNLAKGRAAMWPSWQPRAAP